MPSRLLRPCSPPSRAASPAATALASAALAAVARGGALAGLRLAVDFADPLFVLARPLLRLLERRAQRVDLAADLADLGVDVFLGRAGRDPPTANASTVIASNDLRIGGLLMIHNVG